MQFYVFGRIALHISDTRHISHTLPHMRVSIGFEEPFQHSFDGGKDENDDSFLTLGFPFLLKVVNPYLALLGLPEKMGKLSLNERPSS